MFGMGNDKRGRARLTEEEIDGRGGGDNGSATSTVNGIK